MECEECGSHEAEVTGFTEDSRTELSCQACGFEWVHGPSAEDLRAGRTGGTKHHCPVCSRIYSDPATPIVTIGSPNNLAHRCDRTMCFAAGARYGLNESAMDARLAELSDQDLVQWPRVLEMKRERLPQGVE